MELVEVLEKKNSEISTLTGTVLTGMTVCRWTCRTN